MEHSQHQKSKSSTSPIIFLLLGGLFSWFITSGIARLSYVIGGSMMPTLTTGEVMLIEPGRHPQRGDVIAILDSRFYTGSIIKRLIGTEGDLVQWKGEHIWVNGVAADVPIRNTCLPDTSEGSVKVGHGEIFVAGDNRTKNASLDSRYLGTLPSSAVVGVAKIILWPPTLPSREPTCLAPGKIIAGPRQQGWRILPLPNWAQQLSSLPVTGREEEKKKDNLGTQGSPRPRP